MKTSTSGGGLCAFSHDRLRSTCGERLLSRVRQMRPMVVPVIASVSTMANTTPMIQSIVNPIGGSVASQRQIM